jgi:hypothetical protein
MRLGSGIRDPGSGINLFQIRDHGSKGRKGTASRIRIRNTDFMKKSVTGTQLTTRKFGEVPTGTYECFKLNNKKIKFKRIPTL